MGIWDTVVSGPRLFLRARQADKLYIRRLKAVQENSTESNAAATVRDLREDLLAFFFAVRGFREDVLQRQPFDRFRPRFDEMNPEQVVKIFGVLMSFVISASSSRPTPGLLTESRARLLLFASSPLCGLSQKYAMRWLAVIPSGDDEHLDWRRARYLHEDLTELLGVRNIPYHHMEGVALSLYVMNAAVEYYHVLKTIPTTDVILANEGF